MATLAPPPPAADAQATFHAMGGSATTASHADASRNSVGTTAYMTCMMRAVESRVAHRPPLARDAPAEALFHLASGAAPVRLRLAAAVLSFPETGLVKLLAPARYARVAGVWALSATRTTYIDGAVAAAIAAGAQFVNLGAGLDSRAARGLAAPAGHYELDFQGMHDAKWDLYGSVGVPKPAAVSSIGADLSLGPDAWASKLLAAGYDPTTPSCWLLEGVINYLTRDEVDELVAGVAALAAPGSTLVLTFIAETAPPGSVGAAATTPMHRFFTDDIAGALRAFGPVEDVATVGGRAAAAGCFPTVEPDDASYRFATARRS